MRNLPRGEGDVMKTLRLNTLRIGIIGLAIGWTTLLSVLPAAAQTINLRIASGHAPQQIAPVKQADDFFVPEVIKRAKAKHNIDVSFTRSWGGSLVKVNETLDGVKNGIIDIGLYGVFEPARLFVHNFHLWIPFHSVDNAQVQRVTDKVYDKVPYLHEVYQKYNQTFIAVTTIDSVDMLMKRPWTELADLKGRKVVGSGIVLEFLRPAGITGVQSSLPEYYNVLQSGVADGIVTTAAGMIGIKLYETAKYFTRIKMGANCLYGMTINNDTLKKLPPGLRDVIWEVAQEYKQKVAEQNDGMYKRVPDLMRAQGVTVNEISEKARLEWAQAVADLPNKQAKEADRRGEPGSLVVKSYFELLEKDGFKMPLKYRID
jgi:TRAP-type C4-dicarboxylate transport system substrate-binding protein